MTEKFANRYRIPSARAAWWSYGWPGAYFITICTVDRRHFFGHVTKQAHQSGFEFDWQFRFHDHIIRSDQEYQRINDYIENNPKKWQVDKFYRR